MISERLRGIENSRAKRAESKKARQTEVARLHALDTPKAEIARRLRVSWETVNRDIKHLLQGNVPEVTDDPLKSTVTALLEIGKSVADGKISEDEGRSMIRSLLRRLDP